MEIRSKIGPFTAVIIVAAVVAWMMLGNKGITRALAQDDPNAATGEQALENTRTPAEEAAPDAEPLKKVRATILSAGDIPVSISLSGTTRASETLGLRAGFAGTVTKVHRRKGDRVKKGDLIASIDTRVLQADIARARAQLEEKKLDLNAAKRLANQKLSSQVSLAAAKSALASAEASLRRLEISLEHTRITAPFAGVLNELKVNSGQILQVGEHIGDLVALQPLTISAQVPQSNLGQIKRGNPVSVVIGDRPAITGKISFINGVADERTRSVAIEVDIPNPDNAIPAGISTRLSLPLKSAAVHGFTPALLTLDDEGNTAVKTLSPENVVQISPVNILRSGTDKVWVAGLPNPVSLITVGQGYVQTGEQVIADFDSAN